MDSFLPGPKLLQDGLASLPTAPMDLLFREKSSMIALDRQENPEQALGDLFCLAAFPSTSHCGNWALFMKMNEDLKARASTPWTEIPPGNRFPARLPGLSQNKDIPNKIGRETFWPGVWRHTSTMA